MAKNNDKRAERIARSNRNVNRAITLLMVGVIAEFYLLMVNNYFVKGGVGQVLTMMSVLKALGIIGAAGSFGQFVMLPYGQTLISSFGWHQALMILAVTVLLIVPLSAALVEDKKAQAAQFHRQSIPEALREAADWVNRFRAPDLDASTPTRGG
mgnify:CR=1 FL=1